MRHIKNNLIITALASFLAVPAYAQAPAETPVPAPVEGQAEEGGSALDRILGTQTGNPALEGQNVDPNAIIRDALRNSTLEGPRFLVSPNRVFITFEEGGSGQEQIRVSNSGDTPGAIRGINAIAPIEGLVVTDTCGDILDVGDFCDIAVSYSSEDPRDIYTVILMTIEERDRNRIEIPVNVTVTPAPFDDSQVQPDPEPVVEPDPVPVLIDPNDPRFGGPKKPTSEDIARQYFAGLGGIAPVESGPMAVISLPDRLRPVEEEPFLGGSAGLLSVETISMDPRYSDEFASTEASLPVNRDMILTSDRVIKAVLDTPFSNVMCGKVVALVESDVYSATSPTPLIQAGSRVVGRCGELVQERAGIVWERIITVDGRSIALDGENSMTRDASGLGGALGRVYRTPFDRYILPIFGTFVDIGAGFVQAEYGEDEQQSVSEDGTIVQGTSARNEGIETATEAVRGTSQQIINDMRDVREVLIVPAGTRIDIEIFEDIYFKNERDVVRLGDTVYDVERPTGVDAMVAAPDNIELVPYRAGIDGPVVTVDGNRYVVREGAPTPVEAEGGPGSGTRPTTESSNGRPSAETPSAPARNSTEATLDDLR